MSTRREPPNKMLSEYGFEFFSITSNKKGVTTTAHIHTALEMIYVINGSFEMGVDKRVFSVSPGDMMIFRSNTIHTIQLTEENTTGFYWVLKASPEYILNIFPGENGSACFLKFLRHGENEISHIKSEALPVGIKELWDIMIEETKDRDGLFCPMERSYIGLMLTLLLRHVLISDGVESDGDINGKSVSLIYDCIEYINENHTSDISANDCAEHIHLSYSYFAKLFRGVVGKSFKEYLIDLRLAKAYNRLISGSDSITDIAYSVGYRNLSHFIAEFKKVYGISPGRARTLR